MVEIESRAIDQLAESPIEDTSKDGNLAIRTLNQDTTSRILLAVIALCGFGALLLFALALTATLMGVLGSGSVGIVFAIILVIISLVSFFVLRRRLRENSMLYIDAGCPQCWERELVRVRRHKPDRLIAHLGIPVRRYKCRNCDWAGLRLGGQPPGPESKTESATTDFFWGSDDILGVQQGETAAKENH